MLAVGLLVSTVACTDRSGSTGVATHASVAETSTELSSSTSEPTTEAKSSRSRAAYVYEVIDAVEAHAYYADRVDFDAWRTKIDKLDTVEPITFFESLQLVGQLLAELGDHHSVRLSIGERKTLDSEAASDTLSGSAPTGDVDTTNVGYLKLTSVVAEDGSGSYNQYVTAARDVLDDHACGWIVDLRTNHGGSVPPMLAAAAPLLGSGVFVGYRNRDDQTSGFQITQTSNVESVDDVDWNASRTTTSTAEADGAGKPVALLIGRTTASAAEAIVIAFTGRPNTRSFGTATAGVPTGNSGFVLSDGSLLVLTTTIGTDRNGHTYEAAINPDTPIESTGSDDPARSAAQAWLLSQSPCSQ